MTSERLQLDTEHNREHIHQHLSRYEFVESIVRNKKVLDVACGSGYGSNILKINGASTVIGIDISSESIEHAKQKYSGEGIRFLLGDAENLSDYRGYDIIISFETIEHLKHPEIFLGEIKQSLFPGGRFVVSTPVREKGTINDKPSNQYHHQEWSEEEFRSLLQSHFRNVVIYGQYNFIKIKWVPYSRTLQRIICRLLFPDEFKQIDSYAVQQKPPVCSYFKFTPAYIIAVCEI
jgi:SAM-dependent methyltransferase